MNFALTQHIWSFSVKIWWQDPLLMPTSSATSRTVKGWFPRITAWTLLTWSLFADVKFCPGLGSSPTDILPSLKRLNHSYHCVRIIQSSAYAWLSNWNVSVKFLPSLQQNFTHKHTHCSFIVTLSLIGQTACACAQFSGCSSTTNAHSETGQMAVCCQNLTLRRTSSHSALSMLVGTLFKKFGLFLITPHILSGHKSQASGHEGNWVLYTVAPNTCN